MNQSGIPTRTTSAVVLLLAVSGVIGGTPVRADLVNSVDSGPGVELVEGRDRGPGLSFAELGPRGFDDTKVIIHIEPDQTAKWSVRYRYRLADETSEDAFERERRNVTNPPGVFIERMRTAARRGENITGREMSIQNGSVIAYTSVPHGQFGIIEYRFSWTGFARQTGENRLVVGGPIDQYSIDANESLVFTWQDRLQVVEVSPSPNATQETTVRWDGPYRFSVNNPRLVLANTGRPDGPSVVGNPLLVTVGGLLAVVAAVGVVSVVFGVSLGRLFAPLTDRVDSAERRNRESERTAEPPEELLSDEERVLKLLEENGGRMKQQDVKDALDWSRSKTSNVVNDLQDDEKIEVYRLGRENTLALPGEMDV